MTSYFWHEAPILVVVTISCLIYNIGMVAGPYFQGQLQLLMIARSVVCDPQILFLDEMTASLGRKIEAKVLKTIDVASSGRTVLSIFHRREAHDGRIIKL